MFKNYADQLPVGQIMKKDYIRLTEETPLSDCIFQMFKNRRDEIVVVRDIDKKDIINNVAGIITKNDIGRNIEEADSKTAGQIMNRSIHMVSAEMTARQARDIMMRKSIGRILVADIGEVSGILTVTELLNTFYLQIDEVESKLISILENVQEAICFIDNKGIVTFWNRDSEKLYRVPKEKIIGNHIKNFFPNALLLKSLKDKKPYENLKHSPVDGVSAVISTMPIFIDEEFIGVVSTDKDESEVRKLSNELEKQRNKLKLLESQVKTFEVTKNNFREILGNSPKIIDAITLSRNVAKTSANILITGESGTGKEVFARAIHEESGRRGDFVPINCSAIPSALLESELFGYEGGSFTGALKSGRAGKFELAKNGTLFLDEIGDMPLEMQAKLLRVLQDGVVMRIGGSKPLTFDVRIICATNRDLRAKMKNGSFREDLFYRINVMEVALPPLRERSEDIPIFVVEFIKEFSNINKLGTIKVSSEVMQLLSQYKWSGNIRELRNAMERLCILCQTGTIEKADLSPEILNSELSSDISHSILTGRIDLEKIVKEFEKDSILKALAAAKGNKSKAAEMLSLNRTSLYYKMKQYGMNV